MQTMKTLNTIAATLSIATLAIAAPSFAQTTPTTPTTPGAAGSSMQSNMNNMMSMSEADRYKARWVFNNLDAYSVKRYMAFGYSEREIKGAGNIAMRTGLPLEYILRRLTVSGLPLTGVASMYGVSAGVIDEDIPGFGAEGFSSMSGGMMSGGMPSTTR